MRHVNLRRAARSILPENAVDVNTLYGSIINSMYRENNTFLEAIVRTAFNPREGQMDAMMLLFIKLGSFRASVQNLIMNPVSLYRW